MFVPSLALPIVFVLGCVTRAAVIVRDNDLVPRNIPSETLTNMAYIEQFAAAAYLPENNGGNPQATNYVVYYSTGTCPLVQANMVEISYRFYEIGTHNVTGFIGMDNVNKAIVLAYRGSFDLQDDLNDLESFRMVNWQEIKSVCPKCGVADGLLAARNDSRDAINTAFLGLVQSHPGYDYIITGHSLGGAHAAVAATKLRAVNNTSTSLYTYGQPRIDNNATTNLINSSPYLGGPNYAGNYRITHLNDPFSDLPPYAAGGKSPEPLCKRPPPYPANANDWTHSSPEYHIKTGDSNISPQSINTFRGPLNCSGNSGLVKLPQNPQNPQNFCATAKCTANAYYFGCSYGCTA